MKQRFPIFSLLIVLLLYGIGDAATSFYPTTPSVQPVLLPSTYQTSFPTPIPFLATPVPCATPQGTGICTVSTPPPYIPLNPLPVALPTSYQTAFPTPIPLPTFPYPVSPATTFPVSGSFPTPLALQPVSFPATYQTAFPTPIPFPTLGVTCISGCPTPLAVQPVSGSFPTPLAIQPISLPGTFQTAFPTPIPFPTLGVNVLNTPVPCPTSATASGVCKISIDDAPSTPTVTTVVMNAASVTLLASNAARKSYVICNTGNHDLYISAGATASLTNLYADVPQQAGTTVSCFKDTIPGYTGAITGIWSAAGSGNAVITSFQ